MSTLYLGTNLHSLAGKLDEVLAGPAQTDCFEATTIVVPNRNVGKWLRLWLARRDGVAINLRITYLEPVLWDLLSTLDPRQHEAPLARVDDDQYQLLTAALLLDEEPGQQGLAPLHEFLGSDHRMRRWWRRVWHLAQRLAGLIRDYEYHRQDTIIHPWLAQQDAYPHAEPHDLEVERAQREVFHRITRVDRPEEGLRARLGQLLPSPRICKTLPQYAGELRWEVNPATLRRPAHPALIPVFGVAQLSAFHSDLLYWLGQYYDLRVFHANPLLGRLPSVQATAAAAKQLLDDLAERYRQGRPPSQPSASPGEDLLRVWGAAAAESLLLTADLLEEPGRYCVERIADAGAPTPPTVLARLQSHLLSASVADGTRLPQDVSLQIVACPGAYREVETVHASILHNLHQVPDLKQTEVAVLVTDMPRYRPILQAVFDRAPQPLLYNLADFSAADLSALGRAVVGMLELALESFTRSRVFEVLLNPCFLARLGVEREQASVWLHWAEALGVHHGWNAQDQEERGYIKSPLFGWQLALRRLRVGRIMTAADPAADEPAAGYQGVVPHADLWSQDREQLDTFCRAVEGLLPRLRRLRGLEQTGDAWAQTIRDLVNDLLAVPEDQPGEIHVRNALLRRLDDLRLLDGLRQRAGQMPLALVREFVADRLEKTVGTIGTPLTGGVSISTPELLRGLPFRVVYVLGLGESLFPGSDPRSSLELRHRERQRGDIRLTDTNRSLFLEALLAARDKVYLLYNSRELQRDQELHPSSVVNQLRRHLQEHVLEAGSLQVATVPLRSSDARYLAAGSGQEPWDVLVNYSRVERLVALKEAQVQGRLPPLTPRQKQEFDRARRELCKDFSLPPAPAVESSKRDAIVPLHGLVRFLRCPAEAALRRHLQLDDEDEPEPADDEPLQLTFPRNYELLRQGLACFVWCAIRKGVEAALAGWEDDFASLYEDWQRRCLAPAGAFGKANQEHFRKDLKQRIETAGLADVLRHHEGSQFVGPVQIGAPLSPVGAKLLLPSVRVETARGPAVIVGGHDIAWHDASTISLLSVYTGSSNRVRQGALCRPLLAPLLFGLALRAGEAMPDAEAFCSRFAGRELFVRIAHEKGVESYQWSPGDMPAEAARDYLTRLASDFLDPAGFDLLPADILLDKNSHLEEAYRDDDAAETRDEKQSYAVAFQEAVDDDADNEFGRAYYRMKLLEIVTTTVPDDAYDKIRRRFRPLYQGLARAGGGTP
jgi:exonuclease V gamma subunit